MNSTDKETLIRLASACAPKDSTRTPVDLIVVMDISGSMDTVCTADFSESNANVLVQRTPVSKVAAEAIRLRLDDIQPDGYTNLWDGIKTAFTYLKSKPLVLDAAQFINRHIIVLTDGAPNEGFKEDRKKYKDAITKILNDQSYPPALVTSCFVNILGMIFNMMFTNLTLHICDHVVKVPWILQDQWVELSTTALKPTEVKLVSNTNRLMKTEVVQVVPEEFLVFQFCNYVCKEIHRILKSSNPSIQHEIENLVKTIDSSALANFNPDWIRELSHDVNIYSRIRVEHLNIMSHYILRSLACSLIGQYITNGYERLYKILAGEHLAYWLNAIELVAKNIDLPNPKYIEYRGNAVSHRTYSPPSSPVRSLGR